MAPTSRQAHNWSMKHNLPHTDSWYAASAGALPEFPTLRGESVTDVCVIGGGYTGLSTAIHLRKRGFNVTLLEANSIGWGASGRNGGHVGTGQRADQYWLEKTVGPSAARSLWQMSLEAVRLVCDLVDEFNIDCELGVGNLHVASKQSHAIDLKEEVEHLRTRYDHHQISYLSAAEVTMRTSGQGFYGGALDTAARHLHPLKYAAGLARGAAALGAKIFENSAALKITEGEQIRVQTEEGMVTSRFLVMACNGYLGSLEPRIAGNIMPINNFMIATEPLPPALLSRINRDNTSISDSLFVINYWKLSADGRLLFGGGENYSSRFPRNIKAFVRPYMLKIYPELAGIKIDYGWGGTLGITMNRMPDFGRIGKRIFYAQGFSGHGVPTATMAGRLMADAIFGDTTRFDLMAAVPTHRFPGGTLLRWPGLVAGMLFYSLRDKLGK